MATADVEGTTTEAALAVDEAYPEDVDVLDAELRTPTDDDDVEEASVAAVGGPAADEALTSVVADDGHVIFIPEQFNLISKMLLLRCQFKL